MKWKDVWSKNSSELCIFDQLKVNKVNCLALSPSTINLTSSFHPNLFYREGRVCHHWCKWCKSKDSGTKGPKHTKWLCVENQDIHRETETKHDRHQHIPPLVVGHGEGSRPKEPREELRDLERKWNVRQKQYYLGEQDGVDKILANYPVDGLKIVKLRNIDIWDVSSIWILNKARDHLMLK